jgi:ribonuclease-3 family protein
MFDILGLNKMSKPREYSPLVLAYIGDAVYEVLVRQYILSKGNAPVNVLNKKARSIVNAAAQSSAYDKIKDVLTEDELAVCKRGRNAKSHTAAKNQSILDYRRATGVEALFGYLYLEEQNDRICELFNICIGGDIANEKL